MFKRLIALLVCIAFSISNLQYVQAQDFSVNQLPVPGTMVGESVPFAPLALKGLVVNPQKPLEFQFIVDTGKGPQDTVSIKDQADQLVKYFMAGLTIPEGDLWVNLSPYEKNRMVPEVLGQTDLGRDLLEQDYILKQLTASLIYPEKDLGKAFWSRVYAKAQAQFGTTNVPVNTFNKVWILPDQAQVFENVNAAYVTKATLKVMLDEDYLALQKHSVIARSPQGDEAISERTTNDSHTLASQIIRAIILPEITKEVNYGKNFAPLRQIYQALILAKWYKETIQNGLLDAVYTNKNKVAGVNLNDPAIKEQIYERYLKAYKKGAFNYIKEDPAPDGQVVPKKYFSGGTCMAMTVQEDGRISAIKADGAMFSFVVFFIKKISRSEIPFDPGRRKMTALGGAAGLLVLADKMHAQRVSLGPPTPTNSRDPFDIAENKIDILMYGAGFYQNQEEIIKQFITLFNLDAARALSIFQDNFVGMERSDSNLSTDLRIANGTRLGKALGASYPVRDQNNVAVASRILSGSVGLEGKLLGMLRQYYTLNRFDQVKLGYFLNGSATPQITHEILLQLKNPPPFVNPNPGGFPTALDVASSPITINLRISSGINILIAVLFRQEIDAQNRTELEDYLKVVGKNILTDMRQKYIAMDDQEFDRITARIDKLRFVENLSSTLSGGRASALSDFEIDTKTVGWNNLRRALAHEIGHNILSGKGYEPQGPDQQDLHEFFAGIVEETENSGISTDTDWPVVEQIDQDRYHAWAELQRIAIIHDLIQGNRTTGEYWQPSSLLKFLPDILNAIASNKGPESVVRGIYDSLRINKEIITHQMPARRIQLWMTRTTEVSFNRQYKDQAMTQVEFEKSVPILAAAFAEDLNKPIHAQTKLVFSSDQVQTEDQRNAKVRGLVHEILLTIYRGREAQIVANIPLTDAERASPNAMSIALEKATNALAAHLHLQQTLAATDAESGNPVSIFKLVADAAMVENLRSGTVRLNEAGQILVSRKNKTLKEIIDAKKFTMPFGIPYNTVQGWVDYVFPDYAWFDFYKKLSLEELDGQVAVRLRLLIGSKSPGESNIQAFVNNVASDPDHFFVHCINRPGYEIEPERGSLLAPEFLALIREVLVRSGFKENVRKNVKETVTGMRVMTYQGVPGDILEVHPAKGQSPQTVDIRLWGIEMRERGVLIWRRYDQGVLFLKGMGWPWKNGKPEIDLRTYNGASYKSSEWIPDRFSSHRYQIVLIYDMSRGFTIGLVQERHRKLLAYEDLGHDGRRIVGGFAKITDNLNTEISRMSSEKNIIRNFRKAIDDAMFTQAPKQSPNAAMLNVEQIRNYDFFPGKFIRTIVFQKEGGYETPHDKLEYVYFKSQDKRTFIVTTTSGEEKVFYFDDNKRGDQILGAEPFQAPRSAFAMLANVPSPAMSTQASALVTMAIVQAAKLHSSKIDKVVDLFKEHWIITAAFISGIGLTIWLRNWFRDMLTGNFERVTRDESTSSNAAMIRRVFLAISLVIFGSAKAQQNTTKTGAVKGTEPWNRVQEFIEKALADPTIKDTIYADAIKAYQAIALRNLVILRGDAIAFSPEYSVNEQVGLNLDLVTRLMARSEFDKYLAYSILIKEGGMLLDKKDHPDFYNQLTALTGTKAALSDEDLLKYIAMKTESETSGYRLKLAYLNKVKGSKDWGRELATTGSVELARDRQVGRYLLLTSAFAAIQSFPYPAHPELPLKAFVYVQAVAQGIDDPVRTRFERYMGPGTMTAIRTASFARNPTLLKPMEFMVDPKNLPNHAMVATRGLKSINAAMFVRYRVNQIRRNTSSDSVSLELEKFLAEQKYENLVKLLDFKGYWLGKDWHGYSIGTSDSPILVQIIEALGNLKDSRVIAQLSEISDDNIRNSKGRAWPTGQAAYEALSSMLKQLIDNQDTGTVLRLLQTHDDEMYGYSYRGLLKKLGYEVIRGSMTGMTPQGEGKIIGILKLPSFAMLHSESKNDKSSIANGGIDLNKINVLRGGKKFNVQFDPAQLSALEHGGFEGFTPVITGFEYIKSPFPLLGINTPNESMKLAKV